MTAATRSNGNTVAQSADAEREIVITRVLDAPRDLVWQAWTDPTHLIHWWGPQGFTNTFQEIDVRPGGVWRFIMHGPDGIDYPNKVVFREVEQPARLVYFHSAEIESDPGSFETTVTFEEQDGKTKLTMRMLFTTAAGRAAAIEEHGAIEGANQTIDRLVGQLAEMTADEATSRELVITRVLNAPRTLVWQAWTDPAHLAQWWGPRGFAAKVPELDLRPGGRWRYIMVGPDGAEYPSMGVFREVVPFERIVTTDEFDMDAEYPVAAADLPRGLVVTYLFEDVGDKTRLTIRTIYATAEDRRKHVAMGVVAGWNSSRRLPGRRVGGDARVTVLV